MVCRLNIDKNGSLLEQGFYRTPYFLDQDAEYVLCSTLLLFVWSHLEIGIVVLFVCRVVGLFMFVLFAVCCCCDVAISSISFMVFVVCLVL